MQNIFLKRLLCFGPFKSWEKISTISQKDKIMTTIVKILKKISGNFKLNNGCNEKGFINKHI
jgi:hypothetical protein